MRQLRIININFFDCFFLWLNILDLINVTRLNTTIGILFLNKDGSGLTRSGWFKIRGR